MRTTFDPVLLRAQAAADPDCDACEGAGWFANVDAAGDVSGGAICPCTVTGDAAT